MNLKKLLSPKSIAVIGASEKPGFGLSTCKNLLRSSRQEHIYFIHPKREAVLGKKCYKSISELPEHMFREMSHFFSVYKALEGKEAVAGDVNGREAAVEIIKSALKHYDECFGGKK